MGLASRKHLLPAPTESLVDESTVGELEDQELEAAQEEEAATDLSQRTDRTHHTIPEDGSPITISTNKTTSKISKITQSNQNSQTSLLIEYFEAGKGSDPNRRPSVTVKVIPSSRNKSKDKVEGHLVLTEAHNTKRGKTSTTRHISLSANNPRTVPFDSDVDLSEVDSLNTAETRKPVPIDIQVKQTSDLSDMSSSPEARYIIAPSDISSMPGDSLLGIQQSTVFAPHRKFVDESNLSSIPADDSVRTGSEAMDSRSLQPPVIPRERNLSNERITQKVIEKLSTRPRPDAKQVYAQSSKSSSRDTSHHVGTSAYERTNMKAKNFRETDSTLSPTETSLRSQSVLSLGDRSDQSARSAVSNNINNPKLLQTVEDAIRRLILPELKELKKDQRHSSRSKHDKEYSDYSETSVIREKSARRSTSGEKPRRRRSSKDHAERSSSRRRRSSQRDYNYDSLSDSSSRQDASISSVSADDPKKSARNHRTRDLAAAGLVGAGLTAAALQERETEEDVAKRRRKKRSKSRSSRSASINESEEIFHKHKVPPMPMQSEISSDLTRSSILSSNTATSRTLAYPEVRQVARGSPGQLLTPNGSPPRHNGGLRQILGTHHGNFSEHNLSAQKLSYEDHDDVDSLSPETERYHSFSAEDLLEDPERMRQYERNLHTQHPIRRGLSPIQSVASYQTTDANRHSMLRKSAESMASTKHRQQQLKEEVSISSLVTPSPSQRKIRPQGINLESRSEVLSASEKRSVDMNRSPEFQSIGVHDRYSDDDQENYRNSFAPSDQSFDYKRMSGATDMTSDSHYVDKVTAGRHVLPVYGTKPEIVPLPFDVESGVASLVEPSVLSVRESQSSHKSSFVREQLSAPSLPREAIGARMTSPLKEYMSATSDTSLRQTAHAHPIDLSPPQSPARSYEEHQRDYIPDTDRDSGLHSPTAMKVNLKGSPESDITTNPSVIHGPIGGRNAGRDPWITETITPPITSQSGISRDFSSGAIDLIPEGLNVSQRNTYESKHKTYVIGQAAVQTMPTPALVGVKDEGYATGEGDNYPSPAPPSASLAKTGSSALATYDFDDDDLDERMDDPFTQKTNQYGGGLSKGISPMYNTHASQSIEHIQSVDIMHLMEHLTVRDAQRNARDTEILVTLVRSAAEMRNSFEDMKNFISEQDAIMMSTADKQHAQIQKAVVGPRQMPPLARARTETPQEDLPAKRRNVFKRALQGLGTKNTAELQNIESMLMQLLDEVEALRAQQAPHPSTSQARTSSMASEEYGRAATDTGYEPEGRAGTASSGGDRSAFLSNNSSRQNQFSAAKRVPENRVSVVMEGDEDYDDYGNTRQIADNQRTPKAASPSAYQTKRGQSEPLHTPPRMHDEEETTPTTYTSSDKKHKTFSSFLPKQFVSRWSKTTASTEAEYRQSGQSKPRPYSEASRSGSHLHQYEYENSPEDRLRSTTSLPNEEYYRDEENRPPSPLVPSALSDNPKYQAHRNSQNMQHPQPRQGPTGRNQFRLENAAQTYYSDDAMSPISQISSNRWVDSNHPPQSQGQPQHSQDLHIPHSLSPISDTASFPERPNSVSSLTRRNNGPPRPPKINESDISEPLFPQRPAKVPLGTLSPSTYVDDVRAARAGSPAFEHSPVMALRSPNNVGRKPSGPRPLSASSSNKDAQRRNRFNQSPAQSVGSDY